MKRLRAEFDRRFGKMPRRVVFLSDGGKWLKSVKLNEFPFATAILDFFHATEHLEPVLVALGMRKGTKEYKEKFRYYCKRIKSGKIEPKFGSRGFRYCRIANEPVAFPVTGFVRSET